MAIETWTGQNWCPDDPSILGRLRSSKIERCDLLQSGSNYVFVVRLDSQDAGQGLGIYKPLKGEAPLWDYPDGNLYRREVAAYLVSRALGWGIVPPTVVRDGPHGIGSVQLFIEHDPQQTFFSLRDERMADMQRLAAFDAGINNGDRKGGHCLLGVDGRIWGIDHGLTFHSEVKLRTVIWDYAGDPVPEHLLEDIARLQPAIERGASLEAELRELITSSELVAFRRRLAGLLADRRFPTSGHRRPVPWPPV
jgi:uncharacterized repeat protein (TIGR03843 family)